MIDYRYFKRDEPTLDWGGFDGVDGEYTNEDWCNHHEPIEDEL